MPDTPSIVIVKRFTYRGIGELWSNKYHFSGSTPANAAEWKALADAIWLQERTFVNGGVSIEAAYGYVAGNESSVFQVLYTDPPNTVTAGTQSGGVAMPGDVACWVRWKTSERNSQSRPIYLRKYLHGVNGVTGGGDNIHATARTALIAYAAKMTDGTMPGSFRVCGPQGAEAGVAKVPNFFTTRTLKRRGADPS